MGHTQRNTDDYKTGSHRLYGFNPWALHKQYNSAFSAGLWTREELRNTGTLFPSTSRDVA